MALLERTYRRGAVLRAKPTADELGRLADLLEARAVAFHALGRPIPESRDLEEVARLDPARGRKLGPERAAAAVAAGDTWKAIDARDDARAEFALAAALGGIRPDLAPAPPPAPVARRRCRPTSAPGCSGGRRSRRASCRSPRRTPRFSTTARAPSAGRTCCSRRIPPPPTSSSWWRPSSAATAGSAAPRAC